LPYFGHLITATAVGLVNLLVALIVAFSFRKQLFEWRIGIAAGVVVALSLLIACMLWVKPAQIVIESALYEDPVIESQQTTFQKIVLTQRGDDLRLYLDGNLQFSSIDEYRYHELLVHLPAAFAGRVQRALVIGGGDGLAARELLKYDSIESIVVVDLDAAVTALATEQPLVAKLNGQSLKDDRVSIYNRDAWTWLALIPKVKT